MAQGSSRNLPHIFLTTTDESGHNNWLSTTRGTR